MIALNCSIFEWPGLRGSGHVAAEHAWLTVRDETEPSGLLTHTQPQRYYVPYLAPPVAEHRQPDWQWERPMEYEFAEKGD